MYDTKSFQMSGRKNNAVYITKKKNLYFIKVKSTLKINEKRMVLPFNLNVKIIRF